MEKELVNEIPQQEITLRKILTMDDSIALMTSKDYKERFIAEYIQVKTRYDKLHKMLIKYKAKTLGFEPTCPAYLLEEQKMHMGNYLKVLEIRAEMEKIELPTVVG